MANITSLKVVEHDLDLEPGLLLHNFMNLAERRAMDDPVGGHFGRVDMTDGSFLSNYSLEAFYDDHPPLVFLLFFDGIELAQSILCLSQNLFLHRPFRLSD